MIIGVLYSLLLVWFVFSGLIYCMNAVSKEADEEYIRKVLKDNLKLTIVLEFIISTFTFNIWVELVIIPITRNGFMHRRKMYLSVEDIAELFGLSVSFAYRVVERMNADLASKNYYVILGRVPTRYVEDKIYGLEHVEQYLKEDKAI